MTLLPWAHGGPPLRARLKAEPEDFVVVEELGFAADGDGDHRLLSVRKRGANTEWVARELARFAGCAARDVGYAGLKDRHAVTTQAFSLPMAGRADPDWSTFPHPEIEILSATPHRRKLKRGALSGNRFVLRLRDAHGDREALAARLAAIAADGVPNYFGEQRFGLGGANVERAERMFGGARVDRDTRAILLSAARSQLFNAVLAQRVSHGSWNRALPGEIWCLAGSRSWFGPEPLSPELSERLARHDIHPSGMLWGKGELPTRDAARELEQAVADDAPLIAEGLSAAGLEQDRRPLRLIPQQLQWRWEDSALILEFGLPPGAYATVVVREIADTES